MCENGGRERELNEEGDVSVSLVDFTEVFVLFSSFSFSLKSPSFSSLKSLSFSFSSHSFTRTLTPCSRNNASPNARNCLFPLASPQLSTPTPSRASLNTTLACTPNTRSTFIFNCFSEGIRYSGLSCESTTMLLINASPSIEHTE